MTACRVESVLPTYEINGIGRKINGVNLQVRKLIEQRKKRIAHPAAYLKQRHGMSDVPKQGTDFIELMQQIVSILEKIGFVSTCCLNVCGWGRRRGYLLVIDESRADVN